jgi:uncharacterized protein YndB with AHSA1/START domain
MTITDRIERETLIAAPVERVWELVTAPEHVGAWFGDAGAEIDLRPGGAMALRWEEHGTVRARVERVDPPRVFAYRWASRMEVEPEAGASTLVELFLEPAEDGTLLRVVESGFASLDVPAGERERKATGNGDGWDHELRDLADYARSEVAARP